MMTLIHPQCCLVNEPIRRVEETTITNRKSVEKLQLLSRNCNPTRRNARSGFSLLEAILSMVLLASAASVLFQLAYIGRRHLQDADRRLAAQLLCQNQLREILCGITPLKSQDSTPIEGSPDWNVTIELEPVDKHDGIQLLKVTVTEETESLLNDSNSSGIGRFTLSQWVLDPDKRNTKTEKTPQQSGSISSQSISPQYSTGMEFQPTGEGAE